jgi:hypothetical protein
VIFLAPDRPEDVKAACPMEAVQSARGRFDYLVSRQVGAGGKKRDAHAPTVHVMLGLYFGLGTIVVASKPTDRSGTRRLDRSPFHPGSAMSH